MHEASMKAVFRLSLGLCVLNLILVGGCKKQKNKKLVQYRSTDFISTNQNYTQKKEVVEEKEETPETKTPEDNKKIPLINPTATNTPVPSKSPSFGAWDTDDKAKGENGKAQGNKAAGSSSPKGDTSAAVIAANAGTVPEQSVFDQEISTLISCGQAFKNSNPPKNDWPSCFTRIDKSIFCTDPKLAQTLVERQTTALEHAQNVILLAENLANFAEIQQHKRQLESIPQEVAAIVAKQALAKEKEGGVKYVFPTGVKKHLRGILEKYKALQDLEKTLSLESKEGKNINVIQEKVANYNKLKLDKPLDQLHKSKFISESSYQKLKGWDEELTLNMEAVKIIDVSKEDAQKNGTSPGVRIDDKEWQDQVQEKTANLKNDLKESLMSMVQKNAMVGNNVSLDIEEFLKSDPIGIVDKSVEITGWPFNETMRLNVVDMILNPQIDNGENTRDQANFRGRLYDQFYDFYTKHDHNDLLRKDAFEYFSAQEQLALKSATAGKLSAEIQGRATKLQELDSFQTWQNYLCRDFALREDWQKNSYPCFINQILVSGQKDPEALKQAANSLLTAVFGEVAAQNTKNQNNHGLLKDILKDAQDSLNNLRKNKEFCQAFNKIEEKTADPAINTENRQDNSKSKANVAQPPAMPEGGAPALNLELPPGPPRGGPSPNNPPLSSPL